jgi:hypothetical protein
MILLAGCGSRGDAGPTASTPPSAESPATLKAAPPEVTAPAKEPCREPHPAAGSATTPLTNGGGWLELPTYDGSGQLTHMNVQFKAEGRFGHRYWMTMTPYPFGEDSKENPSILASDNGLDWITPPGLTNPVSGVPSDVDAGGHYSDGYLLPRPNGFELWFRANPAKPKGHRPDNSTNIIYRMTSPDGISWSDKTVVFNGGGPSYMSPSLLADGPSYRLWYTNYGGHMVHTRSHDLAEWAAPEDVDVALGDGYIPWHQEVIQTEEGFEALILGSKKTEDRPKFALYHARSADGLRFGQASMIDPVKVDPRLDGYQFYKSSLVKSCGSYQLYLSVISPKRAFNAFYKQVKAEDLASLFAGP